jgi:quercetin dioxygenase-like cupin family protein
MKVRHLVIAAFLVLIAVIGVRAFAVAQTSPSQTPPPTSVLKEETHELPQVSVLESEILTATVAPGDVSEWHTHRAPVFAYTVSGSYVVDFQSGQPSITIPAGKAIAEPINVVIRARNPSSTEPAKLVLFQLREPGTPFLDPVSK